LKNKKPDLHSVYCNKCRLLWRKYVWWPSSLRGFHTDTQGLW